MDVLSLRYYALLMLGWLATGVIGSSPCMGQASYVAPKEARRSVLLCGTTLWIGMEKTAVLRALGKQCTIIPPQPGLAHIWGVSENEACSHMVDFDSNDKLRFVSKMLGSADAESSSFADVIATFFAAIDARTTPVEDDPLGGRTAPAEVYTRTSLGKDLEKKITLSKIMSF